MIAFILRKFGYVPAVELDRERAKNIKLHFQWAAENKRADDAEASADRWHERWSAASAELAAIKTQRSDNTRRGNITKRLKRAAAARGEA